MSRYKHGNFAGFPQCTSNNGIRHRLQVVACGVEISRFKDDPPGVHFIFFSVKTAPRIGFFHHFKEKEILLRKWDPIREDMIIEPCSADEVIISCLRV